MLTQGKTQVCAENAEIKKGTSNDYALIYKDYFMDVPHFH